MESCIRENANLEQLRRCKDEIDGIEADFQNLAKGLSLAGNVVRLKILYLMYKEESMCPCDLSDVLNMTVPAISQHLRKLRDADLIKRIKKGQTVFYSLQNENTQFLLPLLEFETA
jgi:DNA-binding transcriptional ArsR family regulator